MHYAYQTTFVHAFNLLHTPFASQQSHEEAMRLFSSPLRKTEAHSMLLRKDQEGLGPIYAIMPLVSFYLN